MSGSPDKYYYFDKNAEFYTLTGTSYTLVDRKNLWKPSVSLVATVTRRKSVTEQCRLIFIFCVNYCIIYYQQL